MFQMKQERIMTILLHIRNVVTAAAFMQWDGILSSKWGFIPHNTVSYELRIHECLNCSR